MFFISFAAHMKVALSRISMPSPAGSSSIDFPQVEFRKNESLRAVAVHSIFRSSLNHISHSYIPSKKLFFPSNIILTDSILIHVSIHHQNVKLFIIIIEIIRHSTHSTSITTSTLYIDSQYYRIPPKSSFRTSTSTTPELSIQSRRRSSHVLPLVPQTLNPQRISSLSHHLPTFFSPNYISRTSRARATFASPFVNLPPPSQL